MSSVFHRSCRPEQVLASRAQGCCVVDQQGRVYLDAAGGAGAAILGYGHPALGEAMIAQAARLPFVHSEFFSSEPAEALADALVTKAPSGFARVLFTSGGSEAIEAALKIARAYANWRGDPSRHRVLARRGSYHGSTLGALSLSGHTARRWQYEPYLFEVSRLSDCYEYRDRRPGEMPAEYAARLAQELEQTVLRLGPDTICALVVEPVVGTTLGAVPPVAGYFEQVRAICDRYGILLIADEIMCGSGRTGASFACSQEPFTPDLICISKGMTSGYMPLGAVLVSERVYRRVADAQQPFLHGHTHMAHPTACRIALEVQRQIDQGQLLERVRSCGTRLQSALTERLGHLPCVGDVRGRGLLQAVELVSDPATKTPFAPELQLAARIRRAALERGLLVFACSGTLRAGAGDAILLAPPFVLTDAQLAEIVDTLGNAIEQVQAGLHGAATAEAGHAED